MRKVIVFSSQMTRSGGIENHLVRFCEYFASENIKVIFLCADYRTSHGLDVRLRKACFKLSVYHSGEKRTASWLKTAWLILALIRLRVNQQDSLYLNGHGALSFWVWRFLRYKTSRTIVHHHSSGDPEDQATWPAVYFKLLQKAQVVIACSKRNASSIRAVVDRPIKVIYCYSGPCKAEKKTINPNNLFFGFIGRMIPEKGIETILKLSEEPSLSHIHWNLWGSLDAYNEDFVDAYRNVTYHGTFSTRDELVLAMRLLNAYTLFSTHKEGLPLALLEAMSAGVPWIATDRGGISDLVVSASSTILLPHPFTYDQAYKATALLSDSIKKGLVDYNQLALEYRRQFSPDLLTNQWLDVFGFRNS
jgi:glycosyltransferase involved in cell wall biosynthesis